jgi:chorismate synthase
MFPYDQSVRITIFLYSYVLGIVCLVENTPPGMKLYKEEIQSHLNRKKSNKNSLLSTSCEPDEVEIFTGVHENIFLDTPIMLLVKNVYIKPADSKSSPLRIDPAMRTTLA